MVLQDVDLKYVAGVLATGKNLRSPAHVSQFGGTTDVTLQPYPDSPGPGDHGYQAWSYDPAFASSNQLLTNGTVYLSRLFIRKDRTVTKISFLMSTAAITPTSGQSFAGIYNSAGTLLVSAGLDSVITTANSEVHVTITSTSLTANTAVWVGIVANAATAPTLLRTNGSFAGTNNAGLAVASYRFATNGTLQTSLPSPITPGSNSTGPSLWVALS